MILLDTSVWVDHLRRSDATAVEMLDDGEVVTHPMVIGELACGNVRNRREILEALTALPTVRVATDDEVMALSDRRKLMGRGIGWIDVHLLASALLTPATRLWTHDRRLATLAKDLNVSFRH